MNSCRRVLASLSLLMALCQAQASVVFFDATFDLHNYSVSVLQSGGASIDYFQTPAGGNPGPALQVTTFAPTSSIPLTSREYFVNSGFLYDPSMYGAAATVAYSSDNYGLRDNGTQPPWGAALVIVQAGNYYFHSTPLPATYGAWVLGGASDLQAADFDLLIDLNTLSVDASQHPSFAATMLFGTVVGFSPQSLSTSTWDRRVDNFRVEVTSQVPEPSPLFLLLAALPLLLRRSDLRPCRVAGMPPAPAS